MKRNKFSLSHYKLTSFDGGELIPVGLIEVLPGDTFQQSTSVLLRASPLLAPVMHPVHVLIHHWFVPHRLVWDNWEKFITGGPDGNDSSVFPTRTITPTVGSLGDYLGVVPGISNTVSALPFRGYSLIWNEYYRDQDLQTELTVSRADGVDGTTNTTLQNIAWEKDYFTSSRPWEQKGPSITLPLGTTAPVVGIGLSSAQTAANSGSDAYQSTGVIPTGTPVWNAGDGTDIVSIQAQSAAAAGVNNRPQIFADLSQASAVTVNVLREALALQRFEEARARYGSRYVEYLRYLGVRSSDARLQRPEYLGGGRQTVQFSEVLQTAEGTDPVGELRGHGIAATRSNRYRRFFEEHGYIYSFLSVRPKTIYVQTNSRTLNRRTKEDFFQKELQHIGQQEVLNKELYAGHSQPNGVFGYQDRYDEYRRQESGVTGEFRSTGLYHWHFARLFGSDPALNADFVKCVPTERTFAVPSEDVYYAMVRHSVQARRIVAKTGSSFTM